MNKTVNGLNRVVLVTFVTLALPALVYGQSCKFSRDIEFTIDATSAQNLSVNVGAGQLEIQGNASSREIRVTALACAHTREQLDNMDVRHESQGSSVKIYSEIERDRHLFSWWRTRNAHIDVVLVVPNSLSLQVEDGSGSVVISGVAALSLDDGSGSIRISNISGDVYIDDGSGEIEVSSVNGTVSINDGSGDLRIVESYAVHIIDDGSGSIVIEDISSDVYIEDDGSGGIDIRNIGGDVNIDDAGSGSLNVSSVAGNFTADNN